MWTSIGPRCSRADKVVVRKDFVGVVAETQYQAVVAARQLVVQWNPGPALPRTGDLLRTYAATALTRRSERGFPGC